jgi:hypothetical protein
LNPIRPSRTNKLVAADLAGPFKVTTAGNKYLLIITDCFSKYLTCIAIKSKETAEVARAIVNNWYCIYGLPEKFLTDKCKEFYSQVFDAICQLLDIERINTTPRHPECDGQSEKNIQQLNKMIRAYVNNEQDNWDKGLIQLAFAYNTSVHETIGLTPFQVMYGRKPRVPIDLIYPDTQEITRNIIAKQQTVQLKNIEEKLATTPLNNEQEVDILSDIDNKQIEQKLPANVRSYMHELQSRLNNCYAVLKINKDKRMLQAKAL